MTNIKIEDRYEVSKEGWYIAEFIKCEVKGSKVTEWGTVEYGYLTFKLDTGAMVRQYTYLVGWKNCLPIKLIVAVKGESMNCNLDSLIGSQVGVEIINTIGVDIYTNIKDIVSKEEGVKKMKEQSFNPEEDDDDMDTSMEEGLIEF